MSQTEDKKVWVITISFIGPEQWGGVLCVKEQQLLGASVLCMTHQSGHHFVWSGVISETQGLPGCLCLLPLLFTVSIKVSHHGPRLGKGQKRFTK